mgnify:CR=1 FL=1
MESQLNNWRPAIDDKEVANVIASIIHGTAAPADMAHVLLHFADKIAKLESDIAMLKKGSDPG